MLPLCVWVIYGKCFNKGLHVISFDTLIVICVKIYIKDRVINVYMTRFIKLTNIVVNTAEIISIKTYQNKYCLHMTNNILNGWLVYGSGLFRANDNVIEICKNENPRDYQIMEKWINQL